MSEARVYEPTVTRVKTVTMIPTEINFQDKSKAMW